jgi:predicted MPP superfamily phosphohydrolase
LTVFVASLLMTAIVGAFMPTAWRSARSRPALAIFWGLAVLVHTAWLGIPWLASAAPVARLLAILWLGCMLAATVLLIPFALLAAAFRNHTTASGSLPVAYAVAFSLSGIILAISSDAPFVVRQEDVRVVALPAALDGFRIANLGDVHIGYFIDAKELARGIEAINAQHVDLIAVTGDLVDDVNQLEGTMRALELSNAPFNLVAILGNHEEAGDLAKILSIYRGHTARIELLLNQNVTLEKHGASLHIVGVKYPTNPKGQIVHHPELDESLMKAEADAAFAGVPPGATVIALTHHPAFFPIAVAHGAQLTLASHTHGGQIRLFGRPLTDDYPFLQGLYQKGAASLDVSAGFGHWLPLRFGVPREIVIVTLRQG